MHHSSFPALTHLAMHVQDIEACIDFYARYCNMSIVHDRRSDEKGQRIVWLSEPGREKEMIFVIMNGGHLTEQPTNNYAHIGFALESREAVDRVAELARADGRLTWPAVDEPYPVGYYCGVTDPNGTVVEFSYGQPLGPGAE